MEILEDWFTVKEKHPIGYVKLEMLEGADMKPADLNGRLLLPLLLDIISFIITLEIIPSCYKIGAGLSDPYVKGQLGPYKFQTKIQRKTLSPKWLEEFKIPISSWESPNLLSLQVRDKDTIFDDMLGFVKNLTYY